MRIHVVIPHFSNLLFLKACLDSLRWRASYGPDVLGITVVTTETTKAARQQARAACGDMAEVIDLPLKGMIGGQAIPHAVEAGMRHRTAPVTVTVDPDALVLIDGWDVYVDDLMSRVCVAGINPRCMSHEFSMCPEWNWMAFCTDFYNDKVRSFTAGPYHDIGHRFGAAAFAASLPVHTWPMASHPFEDKAATVCGDTNHPKFCFHAFYSTRQIQDHIPDEERGGILTAAQELEAIEECRKGGEAFA